MRNCLAMLLTPLSRPSSRDPEQRRLLPGGGPHKKTPVMTASRNAAPADSSCDVHRMLENYSRQISQTEGQIDAIRQSQQQLNQEHELDLQALHHVKAEAQQADEASAMLAAEVHQLQMEINAKQADCSRIKTDLAKAVEARTSVSEAISSERLKFVTECKDIDKQLRLLIEGRELVMNQEATHN